MKRWIRGPWLWVVLFAVLVLIVIDVVSSHSSYTEVTTSKMVSTLKSGTVKTVTLTDGDQTIQATLNNGQELESHYLSGQSTEIVNLVQKQVDNHNIAQSYNIKVPKPSVWWTFLSGIFPILLIVLFFLFIMNSLQGGGGRVMQFAKSKAKLVSKDNPKTTFADVAGCEEAVEELGEIKEFLQDPAKFQAVGAKIPKGVLLYGQPGTGKTLLARAVAGEASVPFYSISGSDFVEMFVGVGASRVRDLFE
ncbi:MAG: ATP-dependent metallopeptidase FtsH/Yme1/Tma family protein, partial [Sciscionella sp.]